MRMGTPKVAVPSHASPPSSRTPFSSFSLGENARPIVLVKTDLARAVFQSGCSHPMLLGFLRCSSALLLGSDFRPAPPLRLRDPAPRSRRKPPSSRSAGVSMRAGICLCDTAAGACASAAPFLALPATQRFDGVPDLL